jgi:hypothetical protein
MRVATAAALLALALSGCGDDARTAEPGSEPRKTAASATTADARAQLPRLTRHLIPDGAFRSVQPGELKVEECGITPTYPCTDAFFAFGKGRGLDSRIASLRALAEKNGWRVEDVARFETGVYLNLVQAEFHARYTVANALADGEGSMVQVQVYGPANVLERPSVDERRAWSEAKRRYVREANDVCARTLRHLVDPSDVAPVLSQLERRLRALEPPPGDEEEVRTFLRPLHNLVLSAEALGDNEGEDALPAAVSVGEFTKRFVEAASRYGLDKCALE